MADVIIGSARHDEFGKLAGKAGDQLQTESGNDFKGEVSMQPYYKHNQPQLIQADSLVRHLGERLLIHYIHCFLRT